MLKGPKGEGSKCQSCRPCQGPQGTWPCAIQQAFQRVYKAEEVSVLGGSQTGQSPSSS